MLSARDPEVAIRAVRGISGKRRESLQPRPNDVRFVRSVPSAGSIDRMSVRGSFQSRALLRDEGGMGSLVGTKYCSPPKRPQYCWVAA